jgi:hypothetical protein
MCLFISFSYSNYVSFSRKYSLGDAYTGEQYRLKFDVFSILGRPRAATEGVFLPHSPTLYLSFSFILVLYICLFISFSYSISSMNVFYTRSYTNICLFIFLTEGAEPRRPGQRRAQRTNVLYRYVILVHCLYLSFSYYITLFYLTLVPFFYLILVLICILYVYTRPLVPPPHRIGII